MVCVFAAAAVLLYYQSEGGHEWIESSVDTMLPRHMEPQFAICKTGVWPEYLTSDLIESS